MRHYNNVREMYDETARDLKEMGIPYFSDTVQDKQINKVGTLELNSYAYRLNDYQDYREVMQQEGINKEWYNMETSNRLNMELYPKNPGLAYHFNIDFWKSFIRDDAFAYTYAERLHPQIPRIIHELKARPNTRQAVLTMYDQHQDMMNMGGRDRIPCSMHYQFLIRNGKIHLSYTMRSCDYKKFFLADVGMALELLFYMGKTLNIPPGHFTHFIGSLHVFEGELDGVF